MKISSAAVRALGGSPGAAILAISTVVAVWIALFGNFVFFIDSPDFFEYAVRLVHLRIGSYYYAIGYPLLIRLTGFTRTGSLVPIFAIQTAFAALTPWLAFKTFALFDRRAGVAAAVVCLASLTPFFFENTFFHDQTAMFFGFLSITFASMFFHLQRSRYIYLSAACAMYAYLVRPAVIGFFVGCWGAFALFALRDRRRIKHVIAVLGIFAAIIAGVSTFERRAMRRDGLTYPPSSLGRQIFFNEYVRASPYTKFSGPAAEQLQAALVHFFEKPPSYLHGYIAGKLQNRDDVYQRLFGQYEDRPVDLVKQIFAQPNWDYFQVMWNLPDLSDKFSDRVFLRASLSYLYRHPFAVAEYVWANLTDFAIGLPWHCAGDQIFPACKQVERITFYPAIAGAVTLAPGRMPDNAYQFLTMRQESQSVLLRAASGAWQIVYDDFRMPLLGAMLLGWIASFWLSSGLRWTMGTFIGAYIVNMTVFSFLVEPQIRYQIVGISSCAFAAGGGAYIILVHLVRVAIAAGSGRVGRARAGLRPPASSLLP